MSTTITSYAELLRVIGSLPAPAPGRVRVFRGQNYDYPTMTPTALRKPGDADMIWPIYASVLAEAIAADAGGSAGDDLDRMLLWVRAIKQHYGPGTEFLDVTHSVGVAAWFALHRMEFRQAQAVYGPPGPFNPQTDSIGLHDLARHTRFDEAPAYFYVLDAADGGTDLQREHGMLYDLALAPSAFSSSARIRAQRACLIYADSGVNGGDLSALSVPGTPLRINWPMEDWPERDWSTNQIFPPAPDDDWYAKFVAIPLAPDPRRSRDYTVFDHPITVTLYQPEGSGEAQDQALLNDLTYRFVTLRPNLLYAHTVQSIESGEFTTSHPLWQRFASATALLLEGPMMTAIPPVDKINLGLLLSGLADTAPARDSVSGDPAGPVRLDNVFIEVSALDATGWEHAEHGQSGEVVRGLWLVRDAERFYLTVFMHRFAGADYIAGPIEIGCDISPDGAVSFFLQGNAAKTPLADIAEVERWFAKALTFVRSLSPRWKLGAFAVLAAGGEDGRVTSIARLEWALGEVVSLRGLAGPLSSYCVLRQWGSDEPFYGGTGSDSPVFSGGLKLEGEPYAQVKPAELLGSVQAELAARDQQPPPVRVAGGNA